MKLYSYFRSSAAYRVRIALNLKQIDYTIVPVNLLKKEHKSADYLAKQPQGLVPCLQTDDGQFISQSGAMLAYLEVHYPETKLTLSESTDLVKMRSFVDIIACDIHPICNLRILNYLTETLEVEADTKLTWIRHWIDEGFAALEKMLGASTFCFGEQVSLADIYLVPQVFNALRFEVDMTAYPKIMSVYQNCNQTDAFIQAKPENQKDAI